MAVGDIEIKGAKDLDFLLSTFPAKLERRIVKRAMRTGASIISKEAKRLAPRRTGTLRKAIAVGNVRDDVAVRVYVRRGRGQKNDGWYANLVEQGTSAHEIRPWKDRKKVLAAGGKIYGRRVRHPGARARPFMRPALESSASRAVDAIANRMRQMIEKELAR